jgi:DNA-binding CsgD family transcriptional regulator
MALKTQELDLLFEIIERCHAVSSTEDFVVSVYPKLAQILPHQKFSCGTVAVRDSIAHEHFNVDFPSAFVSNLGDGGGRRCPVFGRWARTRQPVFFNGSGLVDDDNRKWRQTFEDFALGNLAGHGVTDIAQQAASYFAFSGMRGWEARDERVLRYVVPHLHVALSHAAGSRQGVAKITPSGEPLSAREREILGWICLGKSTDDMAAILCISGWTVKIHVRNVLRKLMVSTRTQAVASALSLGIVPLPRTATGWSREIAGRS